MAGKGAYIRRRCDLYLKRIEDLSRLINVEYSDCKPCLEAKENATVQVAIEMIRRNFYRNFVRVKRVIADEKHPLQLLRLLRALNKYTNNRYLARKMLRVIDSRIAEFILKKDETTQEIDRKFSFYPDLTSEVIYADWLRRVNGVDY